MGSAASKPNPSRRLKALLFGLLVLAGGTAGRTAIAENDRPNVLFLISDDQRPDTIHALGNSLIETPHLDGLVHNGTTFTRATCAHPLCVPSRAEILTGATGFRNGVHPPRNNPDRSMPTWPGTMRKAGYKTWWVGKWHIAGRPQQRGFDESLGLFSSGGGRWAVPTYDWYGRPVTGYRGWIFQTDDRRLMPERGVGLTPNISEDFAEAAIEFIERDVEQPFFLQVNFTAPHDPVLMPFGYEDKYDPAEMPIPENFLSEHPFDHGNFDGRDEKLFQWPRTHEETRRELAAYYAVISHMDEQIGRILKALEETGQRENTIIIYSSDHGLAIGSHGLRGKQNMYEHTINVPLIFSGPGIPQGKKTDAQCYLRDLFPTVCDLTDVPVPDTVQGKSLAGVIEGKRDAVYPFVVGYFKDVQRMIRTDRWKLIYYPHIDHYQLFDLKHDPHELHNLADKKKYADVQSELKQKLRTWQKEMNDPLVDE